MTITVTLTDDLATCLALRRTVFIEEQDVPEHEEVDGKDGGALQFLAANDGHPVGTARILIKGNTGKIGRVCVLKGQRGTGVGAALIRACVTILQDRDDTTRAMLEAQTYALAFYQRLGFTAYGPVYDDVGIPHQDMERFV